MSLYLDFHEKG